MNENKIDLAKDKAHHIKEAVQKILCALGEDVNRAGLKSTPDRYAKALLDITSGFLEAPSDAIGDAIFPCETEGMVLQKNIEFFSLCEHHLLPFFGKVHLAYYPDKKIIGLSKIGRLVDIYAKRLQVQENLTHQIAHALEKHLLPKGVAVMIEADHFCMKMRGVKKQNSIAITSEYTGIFKNDYHLRTDFLANIKR